MKKVLKNKPKTQKKSYGDELKEYSEEIKNMYFYQGMDPYSIHQEIFNKGKILNELVEIFKREPNAYYFRLQKLGLV